MPGPGLLRRRKDIDGGVRMAAPGSSTYRITTLLTGIKIIGNHKSFRLPERFELQWRSWPEHQVHTY